ncbi:MAG: hypothetical protein II956_14655 [Bacteroidales bacterium]|nr:hypothetical protein [Bacteroidales bacterium]
MKTIELPCSEITNVSKIVCHDKGNKSKSKITFINDDKNWYFKTLKKILVTVFNILLN